MYGPDQRIELFDLGRASQSSRSSGPYMPLYRLETSVYVSGRKEAARWAIPWLLCLSDILVLVAWSDRLVETGALAAEQRDSSMADDANQLPTSLPWESLGARDLLALGDPVVEAVVYAAWGRP